MMIELEQLPVDGIVRLGCSLFPVDVRITPGGGIASPARFMMIEDGDGWIAAAWKVDRRTKQVARILYAQVTDVVRYTTKGIELTLDDGSTVTVSAARGCACGNSALKTYNPFGAGISMRLVAVPKEN